MTFPGLASTFTTGTGVAQEMNCTQEFTHNNSTPTEISYATNANYQIIPFSSDFRYSDAPTRDPLATLNPSSNLVRSVYWPGDFCPNGGYPVNVSGAPTSSIGGGNTVSANNNSPPPIAATASTNVDNSGISAGTSVNTTNTSAVGITHGGSTNVTTSPLTIGGGPNSGSNNDRNTNSVLSANNIQIGRPGTRAIGDFLLLTVTAQGTGITSSSNICPSGATPGPWTLVDQRVSGTGATAVIQAVYSSTRPTTANETYQFNFWGGACNNTALTLAASAVVLRYTNVGAVDTANGVQGATGGPVATPFSGASTTNFGWTQTSKTYTNNSIASAGWSNTTRYASVTPGVGQCTSSAACDTTVSSAGAMTGATFTFGTASVTGTYTVTLLINDTNPVGTPTCTIGVGAKTCTIAGNWPVAQGGKISLSVRRTGGSGTLTTTATSAATETTSYVSLSTTCSNTASTCSVTTVPSPGGSFASGTLTFSAAVPTGDTFTVTLLQNGTPTTTTCTIAAAAKTCTLPGGLALATGDQLELQVTRTAGTAAFSTTATTAASLSIGGTTLTAPTATTAQPNEQVVRLFGTGAAGFATGNGLGVTVNNTSIATGADDASQAAVGATGTETVSTTTQDNWVAQTVALIPSQPSSITITPPSDYHGTTGDFLLVSISVEGLGGTDTVCKPAGTPGTSWNVLSSTHSGSGATEITQATFWTTLSTAATDVFTFFPTTACTGTPVPAAAAAVATAYNGVNVAAPVTITSGGNASGGNTPLTALTAPTNNTGSQNEEVVNLFATGDAFSTATPPFLPQAATGGTWTNVGESAGIQQTAGTQTSQAKVLSVNSATWTAQTVDLVPLLNSSITLSTLPSDYQANTGDFLLVSVAVQGFGGTVCKPAGTAGASWNALPPTNTGSGPTEITQATFWTTASTASSDTFTFYPSSTCTGTAVLAAASAVATTYTGVNVASPVTITSGGNALGGILRMRP